CRHSVISCHINDYCKSRDYTFLIPLESFEFHDPYNEYWRSKKRHRIQELSCLSTRVLKGGAITDDSTHPTLSHYGCIGSLPSVTPTIMDELLALPFAIRLIWSFRISASRQEEIGEMKWAARHHWAFGMLFAISL